MTTKEGPRARETRRCSVGECRHKHYAKGYCKKHYTQIARHGSLTPERERGVDRPCEAPGCQRFDVGRTPEGAYCKKHARQIRTHGKLTPEAEHDYRRHSACTMPGCTNEHRAKGLCTKHYNQQRWKSIKAIIEKAAAEAPGTTAASS